MKNHFHNDADTRQVQSPAKVNLFLHVTEKRPDGYHNLYSLMCPVTLFDTLTFTFGYPRLSMVCDHPGVPSDERNLAWQAALLFQKRVPSFGGAHIQLQKRIPVAAGLGGGSSNAAAVLRTLNHRAGSPLEMDALMEMGRSLGADVPFFLLNRPAIAEGVGDRLTPYDRLDRFFLVLLAFPFGVATPDVYKNLNLGLTKCKKANTSFALEKEQDFDIVRYLCNDLETVTIHQFPEIEAAKNALMTHGSAGALMSGSGPTVFGLFRTAEKRDHALASLSGAGTWRAYAAELMVRPAD